MNSKTLFQLANKYIPGGVNSPVRAFRAVGGDPVFVQRGKGSSIWDTAGKKYTDYCCSWGALLFGHAPDGLIREITAAAKKGTSFGIATEGEVRLAQALNSLYPSMEKIRLVSSGTEAVMSAVRLARGFTGRTKLVKIDGGYHGHVDSLLVKAGSGGATFGLPDSAGIPDALAAETLTIPFNDLEALETVFRKEGGRIAAFILEPVPANMGVVLPEENYLKLAREITSRHGALLIFDEVITGFRVAPGGAQEYYGITPDLTTIGKILGSGLPIAAFGGRADIMDKLAPLGPVYQAGTLSGNPLAVAAGLWVVQQLFEMKKYGSIGVSGYRSKSKRVGVSKFRSIGVKTKPTDSLYPRTPKLPHSDTINNKLGKSAENFYDELGSIIRKAGLPLRLNRIASMFTLFFTGTQVTDYASAKTSDTKAYAAFFRSCLKNGVYLAPSQFEANFISTAHSAADLERTLEVFSAGIKKSRREWHRSCTKTV